MIRCKTKRKLYVAPEIEISCMDEEELMQDITGSVPGKEGNDDEEGGWGSNAKSGRFFILDDFEDGGYVEDDFNYDNYKKQQMLW